MDKVITGSLVEPSMLWRLGLALLLGGLVGYYTNYFAPGELDIALSGAVLVAPPLFSILFDRRLRWRRAGIVSMVALLLIEGIILILPWSVPSSPLLVALTLLAPLSASFTIESRGMRVGRKWRLAVISGMLAWVGVGIHGLLIPALLGIFSTQGLAQEFGPDVGLLFFALLTIFYLFGLFIAVFTGLLGARLHVRLQRQPRS